jgi:hypothetical protein
MHFTSPQFTGSKALNRTHSSNDRLDVDGSITLVTVFTVYNSSLDRVDDKSSKTVVGNASYNKMDRSMAVLNAFINFIQVTIEYICGFVRLQRAYYLLIIVSTVTLSRIVWLSGLSLSMMI